MLVSRWELLISVLHLTIRIRWQKKREGNGGAVETESIHCNERWRSITYKNWAYQTAPFYRFEFSNAIQLHLLFWFYFPPVFFFRRTFRIEMQKSRVFTSSVQASPLCRKTNVHRVHKCSLVSFVFVFIYSCRLVFFCWPIFGCSLNVYLGNCLLVGHSWSVCVCVHHSWKSESKITHRLHRQTTSNKQKNQQTTTKTTRQVFNKLSRMKE